MIHIHVDGSFSKERGGRSSYGFLVFVNGVLTDVGRGEMTATDRNFETKAAETALAFVSDKYTGHHVALFTDSISAAKDINRSGDMNVCAQKIDGKLLSGYFFINNLRAHTLALSITRKHKLTSSQTSFEDQFKGWINHRRTAARFREGLLYSKHGSHK